MSLIVWYPLNNSLENQGCSNIGKLIGTPKSWGDGKVTLKSPYWENATANALYTYTNTPDLIYFKEGDDFSYSLWLKKTYNSANQNYVFSVGRPNAGGRGYGIQVISSTQLRFHYGSTYNTLSDFADDTWYHIVFTKIGNIIKIYSNGTLKLTHTFTGTHPTYSDAYGLGLGCFHYNSATTNIYPFTGSINDFRIYNHCLTEKEIHELSKGLCVHYKLDSEYETGIKNMYSGTRSKGDSSSSAFTKTKLEGEDGYNFKLTYTGTGANSWKSISFPNISRTLFTPGKKYTWSCKIRIHKWTAEALSLRSAISGDDYTNGSVKVADASKTKETWAEYSRTITLSEGMKIGSRFYYMTESAYNASTETSKAYMAPLVEFYTGACNTSGTIYEFDFDIKDVQIIEADEFPGFVDNTLAADYVVDSTGYLNNGTPSGSLSVAADTAVYEKSMKFADSSYIKFKLPQNMEYATYSYWVKPMSGSGNYCSITHLYNNPIGGNWQAINTENCKLWFYMTGGTLNNYHKVSGSLTNNTWYHVAFVWNKGTTTWYLNGVKQSTSTNWTGKTLTNTTDQSIGDSYTGTTWNTAFTGQLSDFRVYSSVLSDADILALYNVGATIDKDGKLYVNQIVENNGTLSNVKINKKKQVIASAFSEKYTKYDNHLYKETDGTFWLRIVHHNNPANGLFTSSDSFTTNVFKDNNRWFNVSLCNYLNKWEFIYEYTKLSTDTPIKHRWIQTVNPMVATYDQTTADKVIHINTGYTTTSRGGIYKNNSNTYLCCNNGNSSNWMGAIGSWTTFQNGIPGWSGTITTGYMDLYVRIDNVDFSEKNTLFQMIKNDMSVNLTNILET